MPPARVRWSRLAGTASATATLAVALVVALAAIVVTIGGLPGRPAAAAQSTAFRPPPVKHVFTILLENEELGSELTAATGAATRALLAQGVLLTDYYGTGHSSLDNYVAMVSGQGPNPATKGDCEDKTTMGDAGTPPLRFDADGQAIGKGCTYPASVRSLPQQLDAKGLPWKGYMEDMDTGPSSHRALCSNPFGDGTGLPPPAQRHGFYRDKHNPFGYFHAITDDIASCERKVVPLGRLDSAGRPTGPLVSDLRSAATTPAYSFITPNQCHDGHDFTHGPGTAPGAGFCEDGATPGGPVAIDSFLASWVPVIEGSPAWSSGDSMLVVVFDEGITNASCCGEKKDPNLGPSECNGQDPSCGVDPTGALGGGQTGAIVVAPKYVTGGRVSNARAYNHYSYLRSMEDLFGIPEHLGYAAQPSVTSFGTDVYDKPFATPGDGAGQPGGGGGDGSRTPGSGGGARGSGSRGGSGGGGLATTGGVPWALLALTLATTAVVVRRVAGRRG